MKHDEAIDEGGQALARGPGADLAAFYDRRAAAALAYCARLCAPEAIAEAVEAAFARVFEASASGAVTDDDELDRRLRSAVRTESASRASAKGAGVPARRLLERLADPNRGGACELMPHLLAARADGTLSDGDRERMQAHLGRCADCRAAERRFDEAERAFDALANDDAPALGRSLLAEMLSDAPLGERRRFTRERLGAEPPDWLEDIQWDERSESPPVIEVPEDALEPIETAARNPQTAEVGSETAEWVPDFDAEPAPKPEPAGSGPRAAGRIRLGARARKRIAITLLIVGLLLLGEAGTTLLWKEPITAFMAARAQDDLTNQLHKLDASQTAIAGADAARLARIKDADERAKARMALLAGRERTGVPAGDALGTVRIDKLGAEYVVVQSTTGAALRKGPGHYSETPLPGEDGTVGIAGHRTTYEAPFRHIDELKAGDKVTMKMPYGLFTYTVERQRIVPAGYKAAFHDAGPGEQLVLSACHPLYSASQRILVYARLTGAQPLGAAIERSATPTGPTAREVALQRRAARLKALGKRTLVIGLTGSDVKELQRLLGLPASGTFGPETNAAVLEFQRTHGLPVVGSVGSQTKAKLARRPHPPSRPPTPPDVPQQQPVQPGQGQSTVPGQQPNGQYTPPGQQPGYGTGTTQPQTGQQSP